MSLLTLFLLSVSLSPAWGVTNVRFSPKGNGDGASRDRPIKWGLLGGDKRNDHEGVMHFLPGEYVIQPIVTETVQPSDWRITIPGEGARPEETVLKLAPNHPGGSDDGGGNWVNVIDLGRSSEYLRRFVMRNQLPGGKGDDTTPLGSTVEIPRGQRGLAFNVEALAKTARNAIVVTLQVKPGSSYATGYPSSGEVVIYSTGK